MTMAAPRRAVTKCMRDQRVALFHSSPASLAVSPLFALQALANSRETRHFNKVSGLSRVEHSPPLELLRSSEVDPFREKAAPVSKSSNLVESEVSRQRKTKDAVRHELSAASKAPVGAAVAARFTSPQTRPQQQNAELGAGKVGIPERDLQDALFRLEKRYEKLDAAWAKDRRLLVRESRQDRRLLALLCVIFGASVAWFGLKGKDYVMKRQDDVVASDNAVDRKAMWANAANAMSGTRKETYSALQPASATTTTEVIASDKPSQPTTGWFWRR